MFKIQLLNKISPSGLARFRDSAHQFECAEGLENPDAIVVRSADMHGMEFPASLRAVARAGAGVNNIPIDRCTEQGIAVFNTPGANANAVKELTLAGLLISARKVYPSMQWVQALKGQGAEVPGLAEKGKAKFTGPELMGKKLGVIGLGAIGVLVCNAATHLGMEVYGYDPYISVQAAWNLSRGVRHATSLQEIYEQCDFITLHVPATKETKGMINQQSINIMKDGVRILNFARADLVDTADIIEAVNEKKVYCYVTDFALDELLGHYGILVLPHLGASTPESEIVCAEMAADEIRDYLENGNITNSVNMPNVALPRSGRKRIGILHRNKPAMLARITGALGENINNLTNDSRGEIAYTLIDIDGDPDEARIGELRGIDGVIRVTTY
jgi:D-3-phosphoglycerate dehydrogenase